LKYITDSGNYALCIDCGTVIIKKKQYFKSSRSLSGRSYRVLPYCPKCGKFRNYKTMTYTRTLPETEAS